MNKVKKLMRKMKFCNDGGYIYSKYMERRKTKKEMEMKVH
jgi:hypothetical protein